MNHNVHNLYVAMPKTVANGHSPPSHTSLYLFKHHDDALEGARNQIAGGRGYNGMVIFQAVTLMQRSAQSIEVIPIDEEEEL